MSKNHSRRSGLYIEIVILLILLAGILYGWHVGPSKAWVLLLRWICGLIFVLFVPGYALQSALFSHTDALDLPERLALSIGLSVALAPLFAWGLDKLIPTGIALWPILIGEGGFSVICFVVARTKGLRSLAWVNASHTRDGLAPRYFPQARRPGLESGASDFARPLQTWWSSQGWGDRLLLLLLIGALTVAGISAANLNGRGQDLNGAVSPQNLTEFYILGAEGLGENYPRTVHAEPANASTPFSLGQPVTVTIGIHHLAQEPATYRVSVVARDLEGTMPATPMGQTGALHLAPGERHEIRLDLGDLVGNNAFVPAHPPSDMAVQFLLYREGIPSVYRTLRLWLNVVE